MRSVTVLLAGPRAYRLDAEVARWLAAILREELGGRDDDQAVIGLQVAWAIDLVLNEGSDEPLELGGRQAEAVRDVLWHHYHQVRGDDQIDALYEALRRLGGGPSEQAE
jgi:hypothetical protein